MSRTPVPFSLRQIIEHGLHDAIELMQQGNHEEADRRFNTLLAHGVDFPPLLHYAGLNALERGNAERGFELLRRSLELAPADPVFQSNLATALVRLKRWQEAEPMLRTQRLKDPQDSKIAFHLANLLHLTARDGEALLHWQACVRLAPDGAPGWLGYGESLAELNDFEAADRAYAQAQALLPRDPLVRTARAELWSQQEEDGMRARSFYDEALKLEPGFPPAIIGLAALEGQMGRFDQALGHLRTLLNRQPDAYAAAWLLARFKPHPADDPDGLLIERSLACAKREPGHPLAHNAFFAWGKVLEDRREYDPAWAAFEQGQALRPLASPYAETEQRQYMRLILEAVDRRFIETYRFTHAGPVNPIYIVGMPRSGTTLLEQMLSAHPEITGGGEMTGLHNCFRHALGIPDLGQLPFALNPLSSTAWKNLRADIDHLYVACSRNRPNLTDKMPTNFIFLGLLHALSPGARIIHVERDARDTCLSCYTTIFRTSHKFAANLEHLGHYYRMYEALMEHWRHLLPPDVLIEISYESLVRNPREELERLLAFLKLPFEEACLRPEQVDRRIKTASIYQARQPIRTGSVARWQHYGSHLGPLERALALTDPLGLSDPSPTSPV